MALLWVNAIVAASASAIWFLWGLKWFRRRHILLCSIYVTSAASALFLAFGFTLVLAGGDPLISASVARQWVWAAVGLPAIARLIELLREENRHIYADRLLASVEQRADQHDSRIGQAT